MFSDNINVGFLPHSCGGESCQGASIHNTRILAHLDMQVLLTVYTLGIITAFKLMNTMNGFSSSESTVPLLIKMSSLLWFVYVDVYQWKNKRLQRMSGRPNRRREQSPNINKYK